MIKRVLSSLQATGKVQVHQIALIILCMQYVSYHEPPPAEDCLGIYCVNKSFSYYVGFSFFMRLIHVGVFFKRAIAG